MKLKKHPGGLVTSLVLILFLLLFIVDLEIAELVAVFCGCYNTEPVTEIVLLQILLRQVLEISLGECNVGSHNQLGFGSLNSDVVAEVSSFTIDLDPVMKVLLEVSGVHDAILDGLSAVEDKLVLNLLLRSPFDVLFDVLLSDDHHF